MWFFLNLPTVQNKVETDVVVWEFLFFFGFQDTFLFFLVNIIASSYVYYSSTSLSAGVVCVKLLFFLLEIKIYIINKRIIFPSSFQLAPSRLNGMNWISSKIIYWNKRREKRVIGWGGILYHQKIFVEYFHMFFHFSVLIVSNQIWMREVFTFHI